MSTSENTILIIMVVVVLISLLGFEWLVGTLLAIAVPAACFVAVCIPFAAQDLQKAIIKWYNS